MASRWWYNQVVETPTAGASGTIGIDKVVSRRADPVRVRDIDLPGKEYHGTPTATGDDDLLRWVTEVEVDIETSTNALTVPTLDMGMAVPDVLRREKYDATGWNAYLLLAQTSPGTEAAAVDALGRLGSPPSLQDPHHIASNAGGAVSRFVGDVDDALGAFDLTLAQFLEMVNANRLPDEEECVVLGRGLVGRIARMP